jgi:hypothetical protein
VCPFADELQQRLPSLDRPELSLVVAVMLRQRLFDTVRSGWVRVDPLVVDTPAEERPDDSKVRAVRVGRGRGKGIVLVLDALAKVLSVPPTVDNFQLVEGRDVPVLVQILRECTEDESVVRAVVTGVETGQSRLDGGCEVDLAV